MGPSGRPLRARMGAAKNYAEMKRAIIAAVDDMNHRSLYRSDGASRLQREPRRPDRSETKTKKNWLIIAMIALAVTGPAAAQPTTTSQPMATPAQDRRAEVWTQRHSGLEAGPVTQLPTPTQRTQASRDWKFAGTLSGDYLVCDPAAKPRIVTDNATACVDGTFVRPGGTHHCKAVCPPILGVWVVSNPR